MTDTPFWEDDGTSAPAPEDAGETPHTVTIGGHEFAWHEGVAATVHFHDDDGAETGTVMIPYDPDNQPPEEDVLAQANQFFYDMEYMRSIVSDDTRDDIVAEVFKAGATEGRRSLADEMVAIVADALAGSLKLDVTDDDGSEGLTPDQLAALATEGEQIFNKRLPDIVRSMADVPAADGLTFWQNFAREVIATAMLHARDDVMEELGGRTTVAARDDDALDDFERQVLDAYRTGPYIAGAWLTLTQEWTQLLGEIVTSTMSQMAEGEEGKDIAAQLIKAARKSLGFPALPDDAPTQAAPAFSADGYGHVDNSIVPVSARLAIVSKWPGPKTRHPEFHFVSDAGQAIYAPSETAYPRVADAWRVVDTLDDAHVDTLDYILAKALANRATGQRDEYGGFTITPGEILDVRGIQKARSGGHKPDNMAEVVDHVEHLSQLMVRANVTGYTKSEKGKRGKRATLTVEAPLILVSQTLYRTTLDGERIPIAWHLRPGDWAIEMERFSPQLAIMMQGILKLHARRDVNAKRIGRYLVYQYRIRAHQKTWAQPYRISTLLDGAGIDVDRANPGRFRQRIEAALDTLANRVEMGDSPLCVASWSYPDPVPTKGRKWLDRWLESGVVIMPPQEIMEGKYAQIGGRPRQPRKLAAG